MVCTAFEEITKRFGLRPLIVHIYTEEELFQEHCWCYPAFIEKEVELCLCNERNNGNRNKNTQPD